MKRAAGQGEHPLDHDHVDGDPADQRREVARVLAQVLGALVEDPVEERLPVLVHHVALLVDHLAEARRPRCRRPRGRSRSRRRCAWPRRRSAWSGRPSPRGWAPRSRTGSSSTVTRSSPRKNSREAELEELALLLGEHVRVGPLPCVLGEVEVLGRPVLALPAHEQLLVGGGGLDDLVEARHHLVDVAVQQDGEGLVLGVELVPLVVAVRRSSAPPRGGGRCGRNIYQSFSKCQRYRRQPSGPSPSSADRRASEHEPSSPTISRPPTLAEVDPDIPRVLDGELGRQQGTLEMIASENFVPAGGARCRRLGADQQVRRGLPGQALLRRLRGGGRRRAAGDRPRQGAVRRRARQRPAARRRPGEQRGLHGDARARATRSWGWRSTTAATSPTG